MTGKEHLKFCLYSVGVLWAGSQVDITLTNEQIGLIVAGSLIGSLTPDIDHENAIAGSIVPFWLLARLFKKSHILKHGGITHTLLINSIIFALAYYFESLLVAGVGIGYFTHLYADHITGNKLKYLYFPLRRS